jgi:hypothetical protein
MKLKIVAALMLCLPAFASEGLPKHSLAKPLFLYNLAFGNEINLSLDVVLPKDHKLNKGAPSALDIYEMVDKKWTKTRSLQMTEYFHLGNTLSIFEKIKLQTSQGPIAIDSTIYHCDVKNTHCAIESFQGILQRSETSRQHILKVALAGTTP